MILQNIASPTAAHLQYGLAPQPFLSWASTPLYANYCNNVKASFSEADSYSTMPIGS